MNRGPKSHLINDFAIIIFKFDGNIVRTVTPVLVHKSLQNFAYALTGGMCNFGWKKQIKFLMW